MTDTECLTKRFGDFVDGVTFEVEEGRCSGFRGRRELG